MGILAFENTTDSGLGGQERSLFEICEGLSEDGVAFSLAYRKAGNLLPKYQNFVRSTIKVDNYVIKPYYFLKSISDILRLIRLARRENWQVLYVSQYFDTAFAGLISRILGIPLVCHLRLPAPAYLSRQYRWGLNQCQQIVAISQDTKQGYVNHGIPAARIAVVHNAIDTKLFKPLAAVHGNVCREIVFLGRIVPEKGLRTLILAFQQIALARTDVILKIYGDESACDGTEGFLDEIKELAGALLNKQIYFYEPVVNVVPVLQGADILVLPSEWDEPFGRVLIEAMACGVPVIANRIGGIPEVLSPEFDDCLVPPKDVQALASRMMATVDWRVTNPTLGEQCRAHVERKFSKPRLLHDMKQIFNRAVCR